MDIALAIVYLLLCFCLAWKVCFGRDVIWGHLGVLAIFSVAYYPFPVLLKSWSHLSDYPDANIFGALAIHFVFLVALLAGLSVLWRCRGLIRPLRFEALDGLATRFMFPLAAVASVLYFIYFYTSDLSSYSAEDVTTFFEEKDPYRQILSALAGLLVALIALSFSLALRRGRLLRAATLGGIIGLIVLTSLSTGARIIIITPLIMVFAALFITGQRVKAFQTILAVAAILVTISPLIVYMRENRSAVSSKSAVIDATSGFTYGDSPFARLVQGVVDRSDLIYVTINLKDLIDRTNYVGWQFYYSVAVVPIPRLVYPDKPYLLSDNGKIDGEISVLAWRTMVGGLGSLTAFGGLVAYREGGWLAVVLDGLAAGAFAAFLARWLGEGGFLARLFYLNLFVQIAAAKAPASFFEMLASFLGVAPLILILHFVSKAPMFVQVGQLRRLSRSPSGEALPESGT